MLLGTFLYASSVNVQNITINPTMPYNSCNVLNFNNSSAGYNWVGLLNYTAAFTLDSNSMSKIKTQSDPTSQATGYTLYSDQNGSCSQIALPAGYDQSTIVSDLDSTSTVVSNNSSSPYMITNLNIMSPFGGNDTQEYFYFNGNSWNTLFPDSTLVYPVYNPVTHTNTNIQAIPDSDCAPSVLFSSESDPQMVIPTENGQLFYVSNGELPIYIGKVPEASNSNQISQLFTNFLGDGSLNVVTAEGNSFSFGSIGTMAGKLIWNNIPSPQNSTTIGNVTSMKIWFDSTESNIQILAGFSSGSVEYYNGTSWSTLANLQGGAVNFISALWVNNQNPCFVAQTTNGNAVYSGLFGQQQSISVNGNISSVDWNVFGFCKIYSFNSSSAMSYALNNQENTTTFNGDILSLSATNSQTGETLASPYTLCNFGLSNNNGTNIFTAYYLEGGSIYKLTTGEYNFNPQLNELELSNLNVQNLDAQFGFTASTVTNAIPTDNSGDFIYTTSKAGINSIFYDGTPYPSLPATATWPISIISTNGGSVSGISVSMGSFLPDLMVVDSNSVPYFYTNGAWQKLNEVPDGYSIIGYNCLVNPYTPIAINTIAPNIMWNDFQNTLSNTWINLISNGGIPSGDDITAYCATGTGIGESSNVVYSYQSQTSGNTWCTNIDITENSGTIFNTGFSALSTGALSTIPSVQKLTAFRNSNGEFDIIALLSCNLNGSNVWFYNGSAWNAINGVNDASASFVKLYVNWNNSQNSTPELVTLMSDNTAFYYNPSLNSWTQFGASPSVQGSISRLNIISPQLANGSLPLITYGIKATSGTSSGIMTLIDN